MLPDDLRKVQMSFRTGRIGSYGDGRGDDIRCQGKREYETREEVMREIARILDESFGGVGSSFRPYRCRYCGKWHLTDISKKGW